MSAPPLKFSSDDVAVELASHDLPEPPIQWGATHRKTVTRYAGDFVSVQSHGLELQPVEINGELKDGRWGAAGYAQRMRRNLDALMTARRVVQLEYDSDQLWGSFEVTFEEVRRDFVRYQIKFEPYWREDPSAQTFFDFQAEPAAVAGRVRERVRDFFDFGSSPPKSIIDTNWLSALQLEILAAQGDASRVLGVLQDVATFQELALENVELVERAGKRMVRGLSAGLKRNRDLRVETISKPGAYAAMTADFVWTLAKKQRLTRKSIIEMLRRLIRETRPLSTRTYIVRTGDTLQRIARRELGDFNRWVEIADTNDLATTSIQVGQVLLLPRR
jgi:hypothetical protein